MAAIESVKVDGEQVSGKVERQCQGRVGELEFANRHSQRVRLL